MEYKGYTARISFDDEALLFHGEVSGIADVVTFQAESADALVKAFHDSVDDYLEFCASDGVAPEKPFSGSFLVRGEPELHRRITQAAASKSMNTNQWVVSALRRQVEIDCADVATVRIE